MKNTYLTMSIFCLLSVGMIWPAIAKTDESAFVQNKLVASLKSVSTDQPQISFARDTARALYEYNYKNYQQQWQQLSRAFTSEAWANYKESITDPGYLKSLKDHRVYVTSHLDGQIEWKRAAVKNTWLVQVPIKALFETDYRLIQQHLMVTMDVSEMEGAYKIKALNINLQKANKIIKKHGFVLKSCRMKR